MFCDKHYPECSVRIMLDGTIGVFKEDKDSCILISKLSVRDGELYKIGNYDDFNWQLFIDFLKEWKIMKGNDIKSIDFLFLSFIIDYVIKIAKG